MTRPHDSQARALNLLYIYTLPATDFNLWVLVVHCHCSSGLPSDWFCWMVLLNCLTILYPCSDLSFFLNCDCSRLLGPVFHPGLVGPWYILSLSLSLLLTHIHTATTHSYTHILSHTDTLAHACSQFLITNSDKAISSENPSPRHRPSHQRILIRRCGVIAPARRIDKSRGGAASDALAVS